MSRPDHWFRPDVDGLRAVAILAVIAFHAGVPKVHGGFTGVDVFFVISGFLITRNLLRETHESGSVNLGRFWARRIRRLVPALALVVTATLIAAWNLMPEYSRRDIAAQGMAASLYISNLFFAQQATDYFAESASASPFLHTWSLGVEEQFYVVWPLLIALVCWVIVRVGRSKNTRTVDRRNLVVLFSVVLVVSFVHNVLASRAADAYVFYSLTTRAWEFAAAGLLAAVTMPGWMRSPAVRNVMGLAGLATIVMGVFTISQTVGYPGVVAVVPVVGTLLAIAAGDTWSGEVKPAAVSKVLSLAPAQWLGRVSYSWYLWHWPAMLIATVHFGRNDAVFRSLVGLATLPVAWAAYRFFETPLRFAPVLTRSNARTFAAGASITALVAVSAFAIRPAEVITAAARKPDATAADLQAPPGSSMQHRVAFAVELYRQRVKTACPNDGIPIASGDIICVAGDTEAEVSVMLIGDSHAGQWRRVLDQLGRQYHFRVDVREHDGCPPLDVDRSKGEDEVGEAKREVCKRQQAGDLRVITERKPDLVVFAFWMHGGSTTYDDRGRVITDQRALLAHWQKKLAERIKKVRATGAQVAVIVDEPVLRFNAAQCLDQQGTSEKCTMSHSQEAFRTGALRNALRETVAESGSAMLDMPAHVCPDVCRTEIDGVLVYVDTHHLTDAYAMTLKPELLALIVNAIDH